MGELEFYGATPEYGELYYNLHAETGQCSEELDQRFSAERRTPIVLASDEPLLSRKVILNALKLRSSRKHGLPTKILWLDVFDETGIDVFWESALAALVDIWFGLQPANVSFFERRLLSTGAFRTEGGHRPEAIRIIDQISGVELIFVIDVRELLGGCTAFHEIMQELDGIVTQQTNNPVAVLILGSPSLAADRRTRALGATRLTVALDENEAVNLLKMLENRNVRAARFSQMSRQSRPRLDSSPTADHAATALVLVGQPILKSALSYLASISADHGEGLVVEVPCAILRPASVTHFSQTQRTEVRNTALL
jgi:hypothetical protein